MPLYDFHCNFCNKDFESLMKPHDPVVCPHCQTVGQADKLVSRGTDYIRGDGTWEGSTAPRGKRQKLRAERNMKP